MDVYLYFDGNANEAVDFYSKVFEVKKNEVMTYGDIPGGLEYNLSEDQKKLIVNTELMIDGTNVMFSDILPEMTDEPLIIGNSITLVVSNDNKEYIESLFNKLKEGGQVKMALDQTFWSEMFGSVCDKFGITWELNYSGD